MPRTHGDSFIHVSEIDIVVESDQDIIELQPPRIGPVEEAIGKHIAGLVEDGSCLQLGIGGIPDAVLLFLHEKNDLGIHSEMFSEGVVDLYNEGVITNRNKTINRGKMAATFLMGTRRLYDFVDDNPAVNMFPVNIINDPYVIGQNDRVVAINSAIQVDVMGQVVADTMGAAQFTGIGGQVDFVRGAARSRDGKAIIALPSHGQEGHRLAHRRRPRPGHGGHHHARRRRLHRHRARGRAPARPRAARARRGAHRDRRPGVPRPDPGGGGRGLRGRPPAPPAQHLGPSSPQQGELRAMDHVHNEPEPRIISSATGQPAELRRVERKMRIHRQPKTLITGVGAVDQLGIEAKKLNGTKVLVITDQGVSDCGMCVDVERPLVEAGLEVDFYDKAVPEPPMSTIEEIVRIVEKGGYDLIVGFGGGSPIDVAKAAAVLPHTGDTVYDYVGIDQVKKKGLPIIAIPTTAGTGSECTAIAIFANEKLNVKQGLVSPFLMPNVALIDPALTLSCPPNVTAASGMDALIHNIEAYISVNATMHTDSLAYEGIKLISQSIRTAVYDGSNMWARDAMAMGSMMGGIAFGNAGVGAVHALSYPIGGMFHVPHGVANTMVLPWAMDFNKLACLRWFRQIGEAMGENMNGLSDREAADKTVAALRLLADDLGVPQYLSDVDIPESAIPDLVEGAKTQARLWNNNPRKYTPEDMEQVYRNMAVRPGAKVAATV